MTRGKIVILKLARVNESLGSSLKILKYKKGDLNVKVSKTKDKMVI